MSTDGPAPPGQQDPGVLRAEDIAVAAGVGTDGTERGALEAAFGMAIRRTGALMQLLGQAAAERIGINTTDLNCLNILGLVGTLTAGQLAHATGLTTASITGVVDRLEQAGYVRRERDLSDRRRVVIHVMAEPTLRDVASVFLPMVRAWQETASRYSDEELKLILEFQDRTEQVLRDHLTWLRSGAGADPAASPAAGPAAGPPARP